MKIIEEKGKFSNGTIVEYEKKQGLFAKLGMLSLLAYAREIGSEAAIGFKQTLVRDYTEIRF